jgi:hypothetical protein
MAARIATTNGFTAAVPQPLFQTDLALTNNNPYAVSKDGERFLMRVALDPEGVGPITVVLNWMSRVGDVTGNCAPLTDHRPVSCRVTRYTRRL